MIFRKLSSGGPLLFLLYLFVFLVPLEGFLTLPIETNMSKSVLFLLGILMFGFYLWKNMSSEGEFLWLKEFNWLLLLSLLMLLSTLAGYFFYDNLSYSIVTALSLVLFTIIAVSELKTLEQIRTLLLLLYVSFTIYAAYILFKTYLDYGTVFSGDLIEIKLLYGGEKFNVAKRLENISLTANGVAYLIAVNIIIGLYLLRSIKNTLGRALLVVALIVNGLVIDLCVSLASTFILGLSIVLFLYLTFRKSSFARKTSRSVLVIYGCLFMIAVGLYMYQSPAFKARFDMLHKVYSNLDHYYSGENSVYYLGSQRVGLIIFSVRAAIDHPAGVGVGSAKNTLPTYVARSISWKYSQVDAHNSFFNFLVETGWLGFGVLVFGALWLFRRHVRLMRTITDKNLRELGDILTVLYFSVLANNFIGTFYRFKLTWIVIILVIAFYWIAINEKNLKGDSSSEQPSP